MRAVAKHLVLLVLAFAAVFVYGVSIAVNWILGGAIDGIKATVDLIAGKDDGPRA